MALLSPAPFTSQHDVADFRSSSAALNQWLTTRALKNQEAGASRCFVVCDSESKGRVVAYYALAAGSVGRGDAPGVLRRNMPAELPIAVLGRLAVDTRWSGRGIGRGLVRDAVLRTLKAADEIGIRALLVHAIDDGACAFYKHLGFVESPISPLTLMLGLGPLRSRDDGPP